VNTHRLPDLVNERVMEKVKLGLKASDRFMTQMRIQSLFDQRAMLAKLINCFNNDGTSTIISESLDFPNICKVYTNCYLQNMLRTFFRETRNKEEDVEMSDGNGWREFGLPVLGSMSDLQECPLTNFPEHLGVHDARYHELKLNQ
jgi:hypothetical protein